MWAKHLAAVVAHEVQRVELGGEHDWRAGFDLHERPRAWRR
jgi:hypothetical protein